MGSVAVDVKYRQALIDLTEELMDMQIIALWHKPDKYIWVVRYFDLDKKEIITDICKKNGLVWKLSSQPLQSTMGIQDIDRTYKLIGLHHTKNEKHVISKPKELLGAKIIVKEYDENEYYFNI